MSLNRSFLSAILFTFALTSCVKFEETALVDLYSGAAPNVNVTVDKNSSVLVSLQAVGLSMDNLMIEVVTEPTRGSLGTVTANGEVFEIAYSPALNIVGTDFFTYRFIDGNKDTNIGTVHIQIKNRNTAPVALPQTVQVTEDTHKDFVLAGTDLDGDTLVFEVVTQPTHGTLSGTVPNLRYTPEENYHGADSFFFKAKDATLENTAQVTFSVSAVNDRPVALAMPGLSTNEDVPKSLTLQGDDIDNTNLTFSITQQPNNATFSGTPPNLVLTPEANFHGTVTFAFRVSDGTLNSDPRTVSVTVVAVNDVPTAEDQSVTAVQGVAKAIVLVGSDVEGPVTWETTSPDHGSLSGTAPNLTYTSDASYVGDDEFTFRVKDSANQPSPWRTVSIEVEPRVIPPNEYADIADVKAGHHHSCALLKSGTVKCWGHGQLGELGNGSSSQLGDQPGEMANLPAVSLGRPATKLAVGFGTSCAILDDNSLKCWGQKISGPLNISATGTSPVNVPLADGRTVLDVSVAYNSVCAVLDDGRVQCWGRSEDITGRDDAVAYDDSNPAVGAFENNGVLKATKITAGYYFVCALLEDGSVSCWGENSSGSLGSGDDVDRVGISTNLVNLGTGRTAKQISSGDKTTCAVLDNDAVKCWGSNSDGKLGVGTQFSAGRNPNEMGDDLPILNLGDGRTAKSVSVGHSHACAVLDNNTLKCWGEGEYGQLGQGDNNDRGGRNKPTIAETPGINLGNTRTALSVSAGSEHTCAVLDTEKVKCWGRNSASGLGAGYLGLGHTQNRGTNSSHMGDNLPLLILLP